jgi:pyridoxamine 5'-phosphate oxidase|tara:strand:+ start:801 stop:1391 length:591 start_codon:yes stop_codon:yes gene_type:complete
VIKFNLKKNIEPYEIFLKNYKLAELASQGNIEAACLSTCSSKKIPHSRFINIKYINDNEFIFFSNYQSLKAEDIQDNNNVALTFYWNSINLQIRIQGIVNKLDKKRSNDHWKLRQNEKNILSISSNQSSKISSYSKVEEKYKKYANQDFLNRPNYWGGYIIVPDYFEIWQGHKSRINKREVFKFVNDSWENFFLEP